MAFASLSLYFPTLPLHYLPAASLISFGEHALKCLLRDQQPTCDPDRRQHAFAVGKGPTNTEDLARLLDSVGLPSQAKLLINIAVFVRRFVRHGGRPFLRDMKYDFLDLLNTR
jgi:hypothetical protein